MKNKQTFGMIIVLLAGIFWGMSGASGQYLFAHKGVVTQLLVPWRLLVSGFVLLTIYAIKYKGRIFDVWKTKKNALDMSVFCLFGITLCQYTYFLAIEYSNAGTATVLQYLNPVFIMIIVCIMTKKPPRVNELISIVLAFAGTFLIATHANLSSFAINPKALVIGIISAWTCVIYSLQPKKLMEQFEPGFVLGWGAFIGGIIMMLVFRPWQYSCTVDLTSAALFGMTSIVGTVFAYTMYLTGVKMIGPVRASIFASIEPVAAAVASSIQGTKFTAMDIVGFGLIISTIFILALTGRKKENEAK